MKNITACAMAIAVVFVANAGLFDSFKEAATKTLDAAGKVTETAVSTVGNVVQEGASALQGQQVNAGSSGTVARKTEEAAKNSPNVSTPPNVSGESEEQLALKKSLAYLSGDFKRQMDELMAMDDENRYRESVKYFYSRVRPRFATKWQRYRVSENPGVPLLLYDEDAVPSTLSEVDRWIAAHEANLAEERNHFSRGKAPASAIRSSGRVQAAARSREVDTAAIKDAPSEQKRAVAGTTAKRSGSEKKQALEKAMSYLAGDFKRQMDELMGMDRNGCRYQKSVRLFYMNFIEPGTQKGVGAMQWYTASEHEGVPVLINGDAKAPATLAGVEKWIANHEMKLQREYGYFNAERAKIEAELSADRAERATPAKDIKVVSPADANSFAKELELSKETFRDYVISSEVRPLVAECRKSVREVYGIEDNEFDRQKGVAGNIVCFQNYEMIDGGPEGSVWERIGTSDDLYESLFWLDSVYGYLSECPRELYWHSDGQNYTSAKVKEIIDAEFSKSHVEYSGMLYSSSRPIPVSRAIARKFKDYLIKRAKRTRVQIEDMLAKHEKGINDAGKVISDLRYQRAKGNNIPVDRDALDVALKNFIFYKGLAFGKCYHVMLSECEAMANPSVRVKKDVELVDRYKRPRGEWPKLNVEVSMQLPVCMQGLDKLNLGNLNVPTDRVEPDLQIPTVHRIEVIEDNRTLRLAFGSFGNNRSQAPLTVVRLDFTDGRHPNVSQLVSKYQKLMSGDVKVTKCPLEIATEEGIAMTKKQMRRIYEAYVTENGKPEDIKGDPEDLIFNVKAMASFQTKLSNDIVTCIICSKEDSDDSPVAVVYFFDQIIYDGLKEENKRLIAEKEIKTKEKAAAKEKKELEKSLDF